MIKVFTTKKIFPSRNLKRKISFGIISILMVAIFLAPVSGLITKNKINVSKNEAYAELSIPTSPLDYGAIAQTSSEIAAKATSVVSNSYGCSASPNTWFTNCLVLAFYSIIFVPVSGLTWLAAKILDFFVYYSTNSSSYDSTFVSKAWAAVRDVANIFFIITLLYVAIKTILGLNVTDNKRLIGAVIMIALVINFSLFTSKLVIDGSNILAKVFYNNITSYDQSGNNLGPEYGGEKSITVGLIRQFNPEQIIGVNNIPQQLGAFFVITLLAVAIMCFMMYIFLSIALLFVARVVSLWISMIFSPIAFASYSVPFDIPGFGHKEWWSNLFKNAMLAPLFIFFLYIIILFGDSFGMIGYDISNSTNWIDIVMKTIIPFMIIFILLSQAKKLAVEYSGEMGKAIQTMAGVAGGVLAGGVALTGAALGRGLVGRRLSELSRSEGAMEYGRQRAKFNDELTAWKNKPKEERRGEYRPTWDQYMKKNNVQKRGGWAGMKDAIGGRINASQITADKVDHERHELDEIKQKAGLGGVSDKNLSGEEQKILTDKYTKENKSKIEDKIRKGEGKIHNEKGEDVKLEGESDYKIKHYGEAEMEIHQQGDRADYDLDGKLTDRGKKKADEQLKVMYNEYLKKSTEKQGAYDFEHLQKVAGTKVGAFQRMASRSTSGSYDVRNIPGIDKVNKNDSLISKAGALVLGTVVAKGVRAGLKTTLNVKDIGTPQKDFIKDIGNVLTSALKGANIKVDLGSGGGGHGGGHERHESHGGEHKEHGGGEHDEGHGGGHGEAAHGGGHH